MGTGGEGLLIFNLKQVKTLYEGSLHEYSVCVCVHARMCVRVLACMRVCMSECMLMKGTDGYLDYIASLIDI